MLIWLPRSKCSKARKNRFWCTAGTARTGLIIAGYRMVFQNWSRRDAIEEFRLGGFGYHEKTCPNIIKLLETLAIEAVKKAVLSTP